MISLTALTTTLDQHLKTATTPDYGPAHNGLQLENAPRQITRIIAAVDATLPVITAACALPGPSLLLVHHGMFWNGAQPITAAYFQKLQLAIRHELAVYSSHIPLDVHPELGNNAQLAKALGIKKTEPFFDFKGIPLGLRATVSCTRDSLHHRLSAALGGSPVHLCPAGPEKIRKLGIISGGAGSEIAAIARAGIDTFITGEGPHWSYTLAEELGLNLFYGGHYATETFGVKALAQWLAAKYKLPWSFIDHPTGL